MLRFLYPPGGGFARERAHIRLRDRIGYRCFEGLIVEQHVEIVFRGLYHGLDRTRLPILPMLIR